MKNVFKQNKCVNYLSIDKFPKTPKMRKLPKVEVNKVKSGLVVESPR